MKYMTVVALFAAAGMTGCTSVSQTKVGDKNVVQVTKMGIQFFNNGGAPVQSCVNELGSEGAKTVIEANGPATEGLFGISRSASTSGTDICNAVGTK
jgi:hypothetical protein